VARTNLHKRRAKTVKYNEKEQRIVNRAARLDGVAWATFVRVTSVRAAKRRVQRSNTEKQKPAASVN
jgi:hypothetical protein